MVKNQYITMAGSCFVFSIGLSLVELLSSETSVFLGMTNIMKLGTYESWSTYTLDNTVDMIKVYDASLSTGDIISTIISSVLFGGVFLFIGYRYFCGDDLN